MIISIGFLFRYQGSFNFIHEGTPHNDARAIIQEALKLSHSNLEKTIIPTYPLLLYIYAGMFWVLENVVLNGFLSPWVIHGSPELNITIATMSCNLFSILISVLTLLILFLIAQQFFSDRFSLLATLLMALSPIHVLNTHYPYADILATFLLSLSLLFLLLFYKKPTYTHFIILCLFFTLACLTKATSIPFYLAIQWTLITFVFQKKIKSFKFFNQQIILMLIFCSLFIWLTHPFMKNISEWHQLITARLDNQYDVITWSKFSQGFKKTISILNQNYGWIYGFLTFLGIFFIKKDPKYSILYLYPIVYLISISFNRYTDARYLDCLTPFLALLPCILIKHFSRYNIVKTALIFLLIIPIFNKTNQLSWLLRQPDSRKIATSWIQNNISQTSSLSLIHYRLYNPEIDPNQYSTYEVTGKQFPSTIQKQSQWFITNSFKFNRTEFINVPQWIQFKKQNQPLIQIQLKPTNFYHPDIAIYDLHHKGNIPYFFTFPKLYNQSELFPYLYNSLHSNLKNYKSNRHIDLPSSCIQRYIISNDPIKTIGINIANHDQQGLLYFNQTHRQKIQLDAYDSKLVLISLDKPIFKDPNIYQIELQSELKADIEIITDPYELIFLCSVLQHQWNDAFTLLQQLPEKLNIIDQSFLETIIYSQSKHYDLAYKAYRNSQENPFFSTLEKALLSKDSNTQSLETLLDVNFQELEQIHQMKWAAKSLPSQAKTVHWIDEKHQQIKYHTENDSLGFASFGPYIRVPKGFYQVQFHIKQQTTLNEPQLKLDINNGISPLNQHSLNLEAQNQWQNILLDFYNTHPNRKLEFRIFAKKTQLWIQSITLKTNVRELLKHYLELYYQSVFDLLINQKKYKSASMISHQLIKLSPNNPVNDLLQIKSLLLINQKEKALHLIQNKYTQYYLHPQWQDIINTYIPNKEPIEIKATWKHGIHLINNKIKLRQDTNQTQIKLKLDFFVDQIPPEIFPFFITLENNKHHFTKSKIFKNIQITSFEKLQIGKITMKLDHRSVPKGTYQIYIGFKTSKNQTKNLSILKSCFESYSNKLYLGEITI